VNTIVAQTSARLTGPSPARKPLATGCLGVNSRPAEQRNFIARGVRLLLATSDVELLAGGAWRARAANREAMGDEAPQASIRPPAIVDVRRHMSYTMRLRLRGEEAPALAR
jgi:hypothetical protein